MNEDRRKVADAKRRAKNIAIVIYVALIIVGSVLLLPGLWYLWLLVVAICLFRIIFLLAPQTMYQCEECHESFRWTKRRASLRPSAADLYETDTPKCPHCGSKSVRKISLRRE